MNETVKIKRYRLVRLPARDTTPARKLALIPQPARMPPPAHKPIPAGCAS